MRRANSALLVCIGALVCVRTGNSNAVVSANRCNAKKDVTRKKFLEEAKKVFAQSTNIFYTRHYEKTRPFWPTYGLPSESNKRARTRVSSVNRRRLFGTVERGFVGNGRAFSRSRYRFMRGERRAPQHDGGES